MAEKKPENPLRLEFRTPLSEANAMLAIFTEALQAVNQEEEERVPYILNKLADIHPLMLSFASTYQPPVFSTDEEALDALEAAASTLRAPGVYAGLEQIAAQIDIMVESGRRILRELKELAAAALLVKALELLKESPVIRASPRISCCVTQLAAEIGRSTEPLEVIASIAKTTGATEAANIRHAPSVAVKIKVVEEWDRLKSENPRLTKAQAAKDMALDAVDWNVELGAKLKSLETGEEAAGTVRKWLKNGNLTIIRGTMRA